MADHPELDPFPVVDIPPAAAAGRQEAIDFLLNQLVLQGKLPAEAIPEIRRRVHRREELGSTAIGKGIAIPHCRAEGVTAIAGVVGKSAAGIPWPNASDGMDVQLICLIVLPNCQPGTTLRALEQLVRQLRGW